MIHVRCKNCGTYEIVGPGHPATTHVPDPADPGNPEAGQHLITDRSALKHASAGGHEDGCEPHPETGHWPLHFEFMAAVGANPPAVTVTGG